MSIADELRKLLDENASLRERIHKLEMEGSDHFYRMAYAEDANRTLEVENTELQAENAKLRETLKVLMMGTNAELCADRNEADCRMCSMHHGEDGCTVVDAMKLLGIDMYGMPLGVGVDG